MISDTVENFAIDTDELREEILEILASSDKPLDSRVIHARSELSPGVATTAGELSHLIKAGQVRRILSPATGKALYRLEESAEQEAPAGEAETKPRPVPFQKPFRAMRPAAVDEPKPAAESEPAQSGILCISKSPTGWAESTPAQPGPAAYQTPPSRRARIRAVLSRLARRDGPLTTAQIAQAIGDDALNHEVSKALSDMAAKGEVIRAAADSGNRCLWRWPGAGEAPAHPVRTPHKARVLAYLAETTERLATRQIAAGLGGDIPVKDMSVVLCRLVADGLVERTRVEGGNHCRWRWIGGAARTGASTPGTGTPAPAVPAAPVPATIPPNPAPAPAGVDWLLTAQGRIVLRGGEAKIELSARESLALRRFLSCVDLSEIQEVRP